MIEAAIGYPAILARGIAHPVTWLGALIDWQERAWNRPRAAQATRRILGMVSLVTVVVCAGAAGAAVTALASRLGSWGLILVALVATLGLAQRSLYDHVKAVGIALEAEDLPAARQAVAMIVGRDTGHLDPAGVAAAALESLAESFNDAVVAPALWLVVGGLPGLFVYKAVNTADSLIGHREPRWRAYGWASARADDLMNLIPARIAGLLIVAAGRGGLRTMIADAPRHASPNAGWPEAAMAGAMGRTLGGPATYDGVASVRPTFGAGPAPNTFDLARGAQVYLVACALLWALVAIGGFLWPR